MLILLIVLTVLAALAQYLASAPGHVLASAVAALAGAGLALVVVWRSRPGPRAVVAAILTLVNVVLALRALVTPR